ncbi:unnamed protein product, partial [Musa hybrid cultivar]
FPCFIFHPTVTQSIGFITNTISPLKRQDYVEKVQFLSRNHHRCSQQQSSLNWRSTTQSSKAASSPVIQTPHSRRYKRSAQA